MNPNNNPLWAYETLESSEDESWQEAGYGDIDPYWDRINEALVIAQSNFEYLWQYYDTEAKARRDRSGADIDMPNVKKINTI